MYFAEIARKEGDHAAGFAEIDEFQDQGAGFFRGHDWRRKSVSGQLTVDDCGGTRACSVRRKASKFYSRGVLEIVAGWSSRGASGGGRSSIATRLMRRRVESRTLILTPA